MHEPSIFLIGVVIFALTAAATLRGLIDARRRAERVERDRRRMIARRQLHIASQLPHRERAPLDLPVGPGADALASVEALRDPQRAAA